MSVDLNMIKEARERIAPYIHRTPVVSSEYLGSLAGGRVLLKAELFQKTGSFKVRGAFNNALQLTSEELSRGLICFSSGNHAQAVSYAAKRLGTEACVVMPEAASQIKVDGCEGYGASVVKYGVSTLDIEEKAMELVKEKGYTLVHPFETDRTLAGQGTAALEILEDAPELDVLYMPIGCGGLIAGVSTAVKSIKPSCKVIGVEPAGANVMYLSRKAGERVMLDKPNSIADGLLSKFPGADAFECVQRYVDDIITVSEDEIAASQLMLMYRTKLFAEASGAVALAGLLSGKAPIGKINLAFVSGGNVNAALLAPLLAKM